MADLQTLLSKFLNSLYAGTIQIAGTLSKLTAPSDGVITLTNNAGTDFSRLQFGGTTTSFPALKRNGSTLEVKLGDDSGYAGFNASTFGLGVNGQYRVASGTPAITNTAPTIASGFGTSPSVPNSNGTAAFTINVGTGGAASSGVITMPAATTGWICHVENRTGVAANRADQRTVQTASTTTSITVQNQTISTGAALAWTASDVLVITAMGY